MTDDVCYNKNKKIKMGYYRLYQPDNTFGKLFSIFDGGITC